VELASLKGRVRRSRHQSRAARSVVVRARESSRSIGDRCVRHLGEGRATKFLAIVTHPRIDMPPSTIEQAIDQVDAWMESPTLVVLGESEDHSSVLRRRLSEGRITGPMVHDARVAAICVGNGATELLTADRDYGAWAVLVVCDAREDRPSPAIAGGY
jgi:hypothetical protein